MAQMAYYFYFRDFGGSWQTEVLILAVNRDWGTDSLRLISSVVVQGRFLSISVFLHQTAFLKESH